MEYSIKQLTFYRFLSIHAYAAVRKGHKMAPESDKQSKSRFVDGAPSAKFVARLKQRGLKEIITTNKSYQCLRYLPGARITI
jgi:hypothetical protein